MVELIPKENLKGNHLIIKSETTGKKKKKKQKNTNNNSSSGQTGKQLDLKNETEAALQTESSRRLHLHTQEQHNTI